MENNKTDLNIVHDHKIDDNLFNLKCSLKTELGEEWLTTKEAAAYLKIPLGSLWNMSSNGQVPYQKLGRRNRYLLADLRKLLLSNKRGGSKWE